MLIRVLTASQTELTILTWNVVESGGRCMRRRFHHRVGRRHRSANEENAMLRKLMARTLLWAECPPDCSCDTAQPRVRCVRSRNLPPRNLYGRAVIAIMLQFHDLPE